MKKIYIGLVLCLFTTVAYTQFEKGQKLLGGSISFSSNKQGNPDDFTNSEYSSFGLSPSFGWFGKNNHLHGVGLTYSYSSNKNNYPINRVEKNSSNNVGAEFFSQRFIPLTQTLFFTINGSIGGVYNFGEISSTINIAENKLKTKGYNLYANVAPGLSYRITRRFLFDAFLSDLVSINYLHQTRKETTGETRTVQKTFNISSSLSNVNLGNIGLGFRWLLKK